MSDLTGQSAAPIDQHPQDKKTAQKQGGPLRIVLIVIMFCMLGLLGYDIYARRATASAYAKVENWVKQDKGASPDEVHELLGRQPDNGLIPRDHYYEETYSWRRGLLFNSFYVTVLYAQQDGEPVLYEVAKDTAPDEESIPKETPPELSLEDVSPNPAGEAPSDGENAAGDGV